MKVTKLSDDQLIEHIIPLAIEYRRRFGKSLSITGEVGEYKASRLLKLERASGNINEGFDAIDPKNKKVQIKSRICQRSQGRTSVFKNYGFDYALLVLLDDDYEVKEMYQAESKKIRDSINTQSYKRPALSISTFKKIAKSIYPQ